MAKEKVDEFERNGTAFITRIVKRGSRSCAVALLKDYVQHLKLKAEDIIKIVIYRKRENIR